MVEGNIQYRLAYSTSAQTILGVLRGKQAVQWEI
jgi:hypothetical protein